MKTVRMRYPEQALQELKKADPDTPITVHFIRTLARRGDIPSFRIGRGYLLNYDKLLEYLSSPDTYPQAESVNGIRKIAE